MPDFGENALKAAQWWVSSELGITAILAKEYNIRPKKTPYATYSMEDIAQSGLRDEEKEVDNNGDLKIKGHRRAIWTIEVLGANAMKLGKELQMSLSKTSVLTALYDNYGVSIFNRGDIKNLSELLETKGQERAHIEVTIGYAVETEDNVGLITSVEINNKVYPCGKQ